MCHRLGCKLWKAHLQVFHGTQFEGTSEVGNASDDLGRGSLRGKITAAVRPQGFCTLPRPGPSLGGGGCTRQRGSVLTPAWHSPGDSAALGVLVSARFRGHLEKDKRKKHQEVVSGAACLMHWLSAGRRWPPRSTQDQVNRSWKGSLWLSSSICLLHRWEG